MTQIAIATPSESEALSAMATRWAAHLTELGHSVASVPAAEGTEGPDADAAATLDAAEILEAIQHRRSAGIVRWWRERHADRPLVLSLSGERVHADGATRASAAAADALIVLQPAAVERLHAFEPSWVDKTHVIHPSVDRPLPSRQAPFDEFRVVVLTHLQSTTDPLLAAQAASLVPPSSRVAVHHGGRATTDDWLLQVSAESSSNPRYIWHGELNRPAALELLASAHVLACTSLAEGGSTVVAEAIAMGIPVIGTRIDGHVGLLGSDHPGLFPVGDHLTLATMLDWLELSPRAVTELTQRSLDRQHLTEPANERAALDALVCSLHR